MTTLIAAAPLLDTGGTVAPWIAGGAVLVAVIGGAVLLLLRRRKP